MELGIAGRVALVTGAGRGIGRAIAERLAGEGARVAVLGRQAAPLEETVRRIEAAGGAALALVADLEDVASLEAALARLQEAWGAPGIVVHNAARFSPRMRLVPGALAELDASFDVNVRGVAHLSARVLDGMKKARWGRLVFISSLLAEGGGRGYAIYAAAKAAQEALARSIALDFGPFGVTANVVAPGFIETEHFRETAPEALRAQHAEAAALKRLGRPEEIASVVAFLASDAASFVTGSTLAVGGGAQLNTRW